MKQKITQKEAKQIVVIKLTRIAKEAAIACNILLKFYPDAKVTASDIAILSGRTIAIRAIVNSFNDT